MYLHGISEVMLCKMSNGGMTTVFGNWEAVANGKVARTAMSHDGSNI